ncbi:MAG: enoyl-CoA hydratase-related protein [Polyangiales bacterium]
MSRTTVIEETRGFVRILRMNRPQAKNAFNNQMYNELADAIGEAAATRDVRVLLLTGTGDSYSAGQDLSEMSKLAPTDGSPVGFERLLDALVACDKPIVAAVNGLAVGIGMTMLPHVDLVYFAKTAKLRCPFAPLGVTPEAASSLTLPRIFGYQKAAEFLFTGRWMPADEAVALGLGLAVVEPDALLDTALAKATELAAMPPKAIQAMKRLLRHTDVPSIKDIRKLENDTLFARIGTPENNEAIRAFFEKRAPDFTNLPDE